MDELNNIDPHVAADLTGKYGLPLHVVFTTRFADNAAGFRKTADRFYRNTLVCFAVKCNPCRGAVRTASQLELGADTVSEYELQASLEEGIPPQKIVCNGNAKSVRYLEMIVQHDALCAVDNLRELQQLNQVATLHRRKARILLRFAGMPLEGLTAADQSTASRWTKFGFPVDTSDRLFQNLEKNYPGLQFEGISAHIGTQICDASGYDRLWEHLFDLAESVGSAGLEVKTIDAGGGYPVAYMPKEAWDDFQRRLRCQLAGAGSTSDWVTWDNLPMGYSYLNGSPPREADAWRGKAYWTQFPGSKMLERFLTGKTRSGKTVAERLEELGSPRLVIEPGRALIGTAGITIAEVTSVKSVMGNNLVTLDLGIVNHGTNLVTPDIFPVEVYPPRGDDVPIEAFLAGRLCFTGDMISKVKITLNRLPQPGELLILHHTGAYSADHFASNSCGFPRPGKIAIGEKGSVEIWRKPEIFEDVFG